MKLRHLANTLLIVAGVHFNVYSQQGTTPVKTIVDQRVFPSTGSFKNPDLIYYPRPLYFWNNTSVAPDELERQMLNFVEKDFYGGFGILPFGKEFSPGYLSENYLHVYGAALKKAKELGLKMCLYDEFGFPSGGMGANNADGINRFEQQFPDQTIKRLDKVEIEVSGPLVNKKIPEGQLMAVVAMEKTSRKRISLKEYVNDGMLRWKAPSGNWRLMFFMCVKDGDPIVDYLDPNAVRNFIMLTHERYFNRFRDYFGGVITGTFFDEPTMYRAKGRTWTGFFNEKFEKKYGFSPELFYPALWYDIGAETKAARNYLFGFRSELYAEGFAKEINDWSAAHGVDATGHQDQEEVLNPVSVSGDLMKCFKFLDIPGIDKIGGDRPAERFYKVVSSVAYNWDKTLVMSETYGAMGNISWNEIFSVAMDQYAKGINMLIPHAVWYNDQDVTFKPELSYRNPLYADSLKTFNQFLARLNLILQPRGRHVADIAVLYPIHNLQSGHHLDGPLGYYKGGVDIPKTDYIDIANWLTEDSGKDFTFIHPEVLDDRCSVAKGKLQMKNTMNWEDYQVLILPSCQTISVSNLQKIKNFYDKGGKVVFTSQLPAHSTAFGKDKEVARLMATFAFTDKQAAPGSASGKAVYIPEPSGTKIREALQEFGIQYDVEYPASQSIRYLHKVVDGRDIYYFANTGPSAVEIPVKLKGNLQLESWDPHTGETGAIPVSFDKENQNTAIWLKLNPWHSLFVISK